MGPPALRSNILIPHNALVRFMSCLLLLVVSLLWQSVHTRGLSPEGEALLQFSRMGSMIDGDFILGLSETWDKDDDDPCAWVGVTCNTNRNVSKLDFSGWGITAKFFYGEDIQQLAEVLGSLKELDMSSNQLGGAILKELFSFKGLTLLDLSRNEIPGEIPSQMLSELRHLRYLSMARNRLNGSVPDLQGFADLRFVSFADNQLTGPVPEMKDLPSLRGLDLSGNNLTGSVPDFQNLPNLRNLNLSGNSLTGCIPSFEGLPKLQIMYLAHNQLSGGAGCPSLGESVKRSLKGVYMSGNQLKGPIPEGFLGLPNLESLDLSSNFLEGEIPPRIPGNKIIKIDLSANWLSGNIPADLLTWGSNIPGEWVEKGNGSWNDTDFERKRGVTPASLPGNWQTTLNLSHNSLKGFIADGRNDGRKIIFDVLDLSHNSLGGPIPPISSKVVWLHNNKGLSGDIKNALGDEYITKSLRLDSNLFSGDIDLNSLLDAGRNLEVLDLRDNLLQCPEASHCAKALLEGLMGLRELRLGGNSFSGWSLQLPTRNLDRLEVLDLSRTNMGGGISSQVLNNTCLPVLRVLNLSNNHLSGSVPASITHMPSLASLSVSKNRLSGQLPFGLPPVLLKKECFDNNPRLCGFPLPDCPKGLELRLILAAVFSSLVVSLGSCLVAGWRWRVYTKKHQQDADLIATLLDKETVATLMPLRKLKKATSNFSEASQVGVGGFGTVYRGTLSDGTVVAIKKSKVAGTERDKQQFLNEVRILSQVNHQNLVKLLGCCLENKQSVLVLEYVANGTLLEHLRKEAGSRLGWKQRLHIAAQTADALAYLHSAANPPIYHRDVKSANILLDEHLNAKVGDFGISKITPLGATHVSTVAIQGTWGYIDPEYFATSQLTNKSDVYSFGVVLLELISALPAVDISRESEEASLASWAIPRINRGELHLILDPVLEGTFGLEAGRESIEALARLAINCLAPSSRDRWTMREVCTELQRLWQEAPTDASFDQASGGGDNIDCEMSAYFTATFQADT